MSDPLATLGTATLGTEVRPAATLMLLRDGDGDGDGDGEDRGDGDVEVLMMQRHSASAFAAGMWVFPGGRVDEADSSPIPGADSAPDDETASEIAGVAEGGRAFWVAAVRECFEEAGVLLAAHSIDGGTAPGGGSPSADQLARWRRDLLAGTCSFGELVAGGCLFLTLGDVHLVSRWVTPPGPPRRFDTRFFVAPAPPGQEPSHEGAETVAWVWTTPGEAFDRFRAGEIELMRPTMAQLASLAGFASVAEVLEAVRGLGPVVAVRPEKPRAPISSESELARAGEGRWPT